MYENYFFGAVLLLFYIKKGGNIQVATTPYTYYKPSWSRAVARGVREKDHLQPPTEPPTIRHEVHLWAIWRVPEVSAKSLALALLAPARASCPYIGSLAALSSPLGRTRRGPFGLGGYYGAPDTHPPVSYGTKTGGKWCLCRLIQRMRQHYLYAVCSPDFVAFSRLCRWSH